MKINNIDSLKIINIPKVHDVRGSLNVIEKSVIPFKMERIYYLFDIPSGSSRGGHAHKELTQFMVALNGSFEVVLKDKNKTKTVMLNNPSKGLLIVPGIWRELKNFSSGAVCLVVASHIYKEADYIRDFNEFLDYNFLNG